MEHGKTSLGHWLDQAARHRNDRHLQRSRSALRNEGGMSVSCNGKKLINFSSNDYLGLAADETLARAAAEGARQYGTGSGASALVTGYREVHQSLERDLAEFLGREKALLCPSGYQANLAALGSLARRSDTIIQDRLCHASLIDGARLSGAKLMRYPHLDMSSLERQLKSKTSGSKLVVTDGVFSMDGDRAPLADLSRLCRANDAWLMVDDAHGIGITGPKGAGCVAEAGLGENEVPVLVGTLGKSFGCSGAFIAGSEALIEHVVNEGRTYLFTTALSPAIAAAAIAALKIVREEEWRRERLNENISVFRDGAVALGLPILDSNTAIQPLMIGDADKAMKVSGLLRDKGLLLTAIRPPTVPVNTSRLRVTISAAHDNAQIMRLLEGLAQCL